MHRRWLIGILCFGWLLCPWARGETARQLGFQVPPGFEVSLYADDALATDIFALTIDAQGRVVVAGKGYVKILHDTDGDGRADKATTFAQVPRSGAGGMYFDGPDLICTGDKGVYRLRDTDNDGKCDQVQYLLPTRNDGEHSAHGLVRGPDGWYYLITGNDGGITSAHAQGSSSPVKTPNAGAVLRFSPEGKTQEVLLHGLRNPYDLAFNHLGHLFTVDADGEGLHHLPYYAPNRLFDLALGMHHGWVLPGWTRSWSRPSWWPDNVERLVEIGRGSPTGVIVYRHRAFPERYHHGVFSLCWTFGRVYFFPLNRRGSSYQSKMETFMQTLGDVGFAPTDLAVGPKGELFVAIGGRGTRGSVFRVRHVGQRPAQEVTDDPLRSILTADEPLSSWSRARWVLRARQLGPKVFVGVVENHQLPLLERIRAVEILTELFGGLPVAAAEKMVAPGTDPELVARILWSLSHGAHIGAAQKILVRGTSMADPRVARSAWEGLLASPLGLDPQMASPDWQAGLGSADRRVRAAALLVARGPGKASFLQRHPQKSTAAGERLAYLWVTGPPSADFDLPGFVRSSLDIVDGVKNPALRLEAVRLLQLALGDVNADEGADDLFAGYLSRSPQRLGPELGREATVTLARAFPAGDANLDRELARLLGMLAADVPGLPERIAARWSVQTSSLEDDVHYLLVLARLGGQRSPEVTRLTAAALNGIQGKLAARKAQPTGQMLRVLGAVVERLSQLDGALAVAMVADPNFGQPGHALYAHKLPLAQKQTATRKLLAGLAKLDEDEARAAWNSELVGLVATLPEAECLPILRNQFADPRLTDPIALQLARRRLPEDRHRLVAGLSSTQPGVVNAVAAALLTMSHKTKAATPLEIGQAIRALRRLEGQKVDQQLRHKLLELLTSWSGQQLPPKKPQDEVAGRWVAWFAQQYPKEAAALPGLANVSFAAWKQRLDRIDWDKGSAARGGILAQRKNCSRCHGEAGRLGPDLTGVAQRLSRDDLFVAILDPSKDISLAYRPMTIITTAGKAHNGLVINQSPDLLLLQTAPDNTVRIRREEVQLLQPGTTSFMPTGLLDDLQDADLADLYAHLKSLRKQ